MKDFFDRKFLKMKKIKFIISFFLLNKNDAVFIFSFVVLLVGMGHLLFNNVESAAISLGAGIFLLLLCDSDRFEFLKVFGFEAKIKQLNNVASEANKVVGEAHKVASRLKVLALSTAKSIVSIISNDEAYFETYTRRTEWRMIEEIKGNLISLDVSDFDVNEVMSPFYKSVERRLCEPYRVVVSECLNKKYENSSDKKHEVSALFLSLSKMKRESVDEWLSKVSDFEDLKSLPSEVQMDLTRALLEVKLDLFEWRSERKIRRPDFYFKGG